ncbi:hypothetical protein JW926_03410 [Candidatus Sumerlaeota bacterium]|nr:hypothetical protein [Candidatus Sumerlaeota bacterium]
MKNLWKFLHLFNLITLVCSGCSVIRIESEPSGATLLHSSNGMAPWKKLGSPDHPLVTPAVLRRFRSDQEFFRVEKSGYASPLPRIAETYPFHRETLHFQLEKTPQTIEREFRDKGYILYQNQWIDPKGAGLVEYKGEWMKPEEKFAAEQKDRGMVLYEGKWMTLEEKEKAFRAVQTSRGLVSFKERWMTRDEKNQEELIDQKVDEVSSGVHRNPDIPGVVGTITENKTRIRVLNGTGNQIIFYFSGKKSLRVALDPYESQNLDILPGKYRIAGVGVNRDIQPSFWTFEFKPGFRYSLVEEGEPLQIESAEGLAISPDIIRKQYDIPELKIPDSPTSGTREKPNANGVTDEKDGVNKGGLQ